MDMSFQKEHINCFVVCSGELRFLAPSSRSFKENNST